MKRYNAKLKYIRPIDDVMASIETQMFEKPNGEWVKWEDVQVALTDAAWDAKMLYGAEQDIDFGETKTPKERFLAEVYSALQEHNELIKSKSCD